MANLIEKVDFNSTGVFDSHDLDISWAYIQVKKLYELEQAEILAGTLKEENATLNSNTFVDKVKEVYSANQEAGIALKTDDVPTILPGSLSVGVPNPSKKLNFKKQWLFNNPRTNAGEVLDSVSGLPKGQLINSFWTPTDKNIDTPNMYLQGGGKGEVLLNDEGDLRSDRNWTFYVKGAIRRPLNGGALVSKGTFGVFTWENTMSPKGLGLRVSSSGQYFGKGATSIHNYFDTPFSIDELKNKDMELSVVREGLSISVYINGKNCVKLGGDQPDPIIGADKTEPIKLHSNTWSRIDVCYISETDFVNDDVLNVAGEYSGNKTSFAFAHDMDINDSFYASKQYFPDKFGAFARIWNTPYGNPSVGAPNAQNHWVEPPSNFDTSNGYVAKDYCLRLGTHRNAEYMTLPAVDFNKDFTISFWYANAPGDFFQLDCQDGTKISLRSHSSNSNENSMRLRWGGVETVFAIDGFAPGPLTKWQHITLVKNGDYFTLFGNGKHDENTWKPRKLDKTTQQTLGSASVRFNGNFKDYYAYFSHVRVLHYAFCEIPYKNNGRKSDYRIFPNLINPIEPGRLS